MSEIAECKFHKDFLAMNAIKIKMPSIAAKNKMMVVLDIMLLLNCVFGEGV